MEDLAITVVIPLYNGAEFIEEALHSVQTQSLPPAKIYVVNDGSTDSGPDMVARMVRGSNISLIKKQNGGQASARNLGIAETTTPLVALLDQDDVWYPRHLEDLVTPFREARDSLPGWVYSNLDTIDRAGNVIARAHLDDFTRTEHPKRTLTGCLANDMFVVPSATMINVAAFRSVGGFDEQLIGYEDDDLFLRMFRAGHGNVYLPDVLSRWRVHAGSASGSPSMLLSRIKYFRKLYGTLPMLDGTDRSYADAFVAPRFFKATMLDYQRALHLADRTAGECALAVLLELLPHLSRRPHLIAQATLLLRGLSRFPLVGRTVANVAPAAWSIYKRVFRSR